MDSSRHIRDRLDSDNLSEDLEGFHFFPQFPLELQVEIWKLAVRQGRTIHMRRAYPNPNIRKTLFINISDPPPLLSTTSESRVVAKKLYVLGFEAKLDHKTPMYFHPADTLYFQGHESLWKFMDGDSRCTRPQLLNTCSIESVAIGCLVQKQDKDAVIDRYDRDFGKWLGWRKRGTESVVVNRLTRLTSLRQLVLVIQETSTGPNSEARSYEEDQILSFRSAIEESLLRLFLFQDRPTAINKEKNGWHGLALPVTASQWWQSPRITILKQFEVTSDMVAPFDGGDATYERSRKLHLDGEWEKVTQVYSNQVRRLTRSAKASGRKGLSYLASQDFHEIDSLTRVHEAAKARYIEKSVDCTGYASYNDFVQSTK